MEKNINLAKILNGKPVNTKLWSPLFGDVYTSSTCSEDTIIVVNHHAESSSFYNNGKYFNHAEAELLLFPSKEMRDWSKFAWKKGDILVNKDAKVHIIFDRFEDGAYKTFHGQYYLWEEGGSIVNFEEDENYMQTSEFYKANKEEAQTYINTIEERLGGKLNRETLEIEKAQPEFKDGDIVCISGMGYLAYGIVKSINNSSKKLEYYVLNDMSTLKFKDWLSFEDKQIQPITETQQIILFDTLAKRGKAWDAKKKAIVGLKPKFDELKPFDKVLVRDRESDKWRANLFGYIDKYEYYHCVFANWVYCIPYAGNEHLLGTTKDVEG